MKKVLFIVWVVFTLFTINAFGLGSLKYTHGNVNIRAARSTSSDKIGMLKTNECVKVDFLKNNWYAIFKVNETNRDEKNAIGYVYAPLLFSNKLIVCMQYDKIMRRLSDTFLIEYNPLLDGTPRYIGQTSDNGVQIELIGTKSNITEATLIVFLSQSDYLATQRTAISIIFLNDTVPGISADWFEKTTLEASDKLNRGLNPNKTEYIGYRKIEFKVESLLGCFVIKIK